jgi:hypothetical protein
MAAERFPYPLHLGVTEAALPDFLGTVAVRRGHRRPARWRASAHHPGLLSADPVEEDRAGIAI